MKHRPREEVQAELKETRERLELYLRREEAMIGRSGVQEYAIGTRRIKRYDMSLTEIQGMIEKLRKRIRELENEMAGKPSRRAVGVVPCDW